MTRGYARVLRGPQTRPTSDRLRRRPQHPAVHSWWADPGSEYLGAGETVRREQLTNVEAVLMVADEPLNPRRLASAAGLADGTEARRVVRQLQANYERDGSAFQVADIAGGFQLLTRPEYHPWLLRLQRTSNEMRLTGVLRETLAIIAYRQPIMRADVENIRGVHCGETLRQLMEKGLIRIAGRDSSLGRPVLYGTTKKFLQIFGMNSLKDLPLVDQFSPPAGKSNINSD